MKTKTVGKMATALMVLLMVLSSVMVMHTSVRAEEEKTGAIEGTIDAQYGTIPAGFEVKLKELSTGSVFTQETKKGGYFKFSDLDIGYYQVVVDSQYHGDKAYLQDVFTPSGDLGYENTEGTTTVDLIDPVQTRDITATLSGNITDAQDDPINGATVTLTDADNYSVSTMTYTEEIENENGTVVDEWDGYYTIPVYEKDDSDNNVTFDITVEKEGYNHTIKKSVEVANYSEDDLTHYNLTLGETPVVTGYLSAADGGYIEKPLDVMLYNASKGVFHKRISEGPYFEIGASTGNFTLVVNAEGYSSYLNKKVEVTKDDYKKMGTIDVTESQEESIETDIDFDGLENVTVTRTRTLTPDTTIPGLGYSFLGNLRMQIDFALGNKNLDVNSTEVKDFKAYLEYQEAKIPSTYGFLSVDDMAYNLTTYDFDPSLSNLADDAMNQDYDGMEVTSTMEYESYEDITEQDNHLMDMTIDNDGLSGTYQDYTYNVYLPAGYERIASDNQYIPSGVEVNNFTDVEIDPYDANGETSDLVLDIRESDLGKAEINAVNTEYVHPMENETLVQQGENVTFRAKVTEDPVGDIENYSWSVDGTEIGKYGEEIKHQFTDEGEKKLSVEIKSGGGDPTTAELNVTVDGTAPQGSITADNDTVEEGTEVTFTADFTDTDGNINTYEWNFTDERPHETLTHPENNLTHRFDLKGTYPVKVTVSDVVGNEMTKTMTPALEVTDATDPVPKFNMTVYENGEEETYTSDDMTVRNVVINQSMSATFDASPSYDPEGHEIPEDDVDSVNWTIKKDDNEEEQSSEMLIDNYTFGKLGTYTIELNVSDGNGNSAMITRTIEVDPGAVPELGVTNITISGELKDGNKVTVKVNVSNYGDGPADMIDVSFKVGDDSKSIDDFTFHKKGEEKDNNSIPAGDYRVIKFDWNIDGDGKKTISVNVTDSNEPITMGYLSNNEMQKEFDIEPPMWREYLVYILVPVIIIGVTVGLYYYRERFM